MKIKNELGYIDISRKAIADIAGNAAMGCYGLVGMAHQRGKDGLIEIMSGEQASKGVGVKIDDDGKLIIDLYVIVEQAIKTVSYTHLDVYKRQIMALWSVMKHRLSVMKDYSKLGLRQIISFFLIIVVITAFDRSCNRLNFE